MKAPEVKSEAVKVGNSETESSATLDDPAPEIKNSPAGTALARGIGGDNSLPELAARINAEHEAALLALQRALGHAITAGALLLEAKARLAHGEWLPVRGAIELVQVIERAERLGLPNIGSHPHADRGLDLYETPGVAVRALLQVERLSGTIWEPACGRGAIARVLREAGHNVIATDIEDYGCPDATADVDFLAQQRAPGDVKTILTNPPFRWANDFVRHALALAPRVVIFQRLTFLEGQARSDVLDGGQLARVHVFRNRIPMLHRDGWDGPKIERSLCPYCWFVWEQNHEGRAQLDRIDCERADNAAAVAAFEDLTRETAE
jgi:predicted RNA methylase